MPGILGDFLCMHFPATAHPTGDGSGWTDREMRNIAWRIRRNRENGHAARTAHGDAARRRHRPDRGRYYRTAVDRHRFKRDFDPTTGPFSSSGTMTGPRQQAVGPRLPDGPSRKWLF